MSGPQLRAAPASLPLHLLQRANAGLAGRPVCGLLDYKGCSLLPNSFFSFDPPRSYEVGWDRETEAGRGRTQAVVVVTEITELVNGKAEPHV